MKLSLRPCALNTAVSFFYRLDKCSLAKQLVPIGHRLIHTAVMLQPSSSSSSSHRETAMDRPSPARQFPAGLQVSSCCGLHKRLCPFMSCLSPFEEDPCRRQITRDFLSPLEDTFLVWWTQKTLTCCWRVMAFAYLAQRYDVTHFLLSSAASLCSPQFSSCRPSAFSSSNCPLFSFTAPGTKGSGSSIYSNTNNHKWK